MVPAKSISDLRQGSVGHLAAEVHGDLSGHGDIFRPFFAKQVILLYIIKTADAFNDIFNCDILACMYGEVF